MAKRGHFPREKGMQRIFEQTGIPLPPNPRAGLSPVTSSSLVLPCMYYRYNPRKQTARLYIHSGDRGSMDLDSDDTANDTGNEENSESETSLEEARSHA